MHSESSDDRPAFVIDGRSYVSAGVLFYTEDSEGKIFFMMQKVYHTDWLWEDFGGKSEACDKSIKDVAFRECVQELNGAGGITLSFLDSLLTDKRSFTYKIPELKYVLYILYLPYSFKEDVPVSEFGTEEYHDSIKRDVRWLPYYDFYEINDEDIHPRLRPDEFKINFPLFLAKSKMKCANILY